MQTTTSIAYRNLIRLFFTVLLAGFLAGCATTNTASLAKIRAAAERGDRDGQTALGAAYLYGLMGLLRDDREAARWLRQAAEQGQALAQFDMGELHRTGRGVDKDETEAVKWFRRSAAQGNAFGQHNLGIAFCEGFGGLIKDNVQCAMWLKLAAAQGYAPESLRDRERGMSTQEIATATRLAAEWKPVAETTDREGRNR